MTHSRRSRRVVVTGLGALTPLGNSIDETWANILEGRSGVGHLSLFDTTAHGGAPVTIAAEVKNFDVTKQVGPYYPHATAQDQGPALTQASSAKDARRVARFAHFALGASLAAYEDSGLDRCRPTVDSRRMGVNFGIGMGGLPEIEAVYDDFLAKGYRRVTPFFIPQAIPNMAGGVLSILLNLKGPNLCTVTACASSAHAIGEAYRQIQEGAADVMFTGGAEAVICRLAIGGFSSMKALSTRNEEPQKASRPFDRDRDGFVMGEGACIFVLEELEHARKRGAKIYGEIMGYGASGDAHHMTHPAPEGEGGERSMRTALQDSGLKPLDIGYVNAHGTSTPAGDVEECRAVVKVFSEKRSEKLAISSTKSMTGHMLGTAGAIEAAFCLLAIRDGMLPPTINLDNLDPGCAELDLEFIANKPLKRQVRYAISNSFGFGGTNASLIVGRPEDLTS